MDIQSEQRESRDSAASLPRAEQQVMIPSGDAVQTPDQGRQRAQLLNGVSGHVPGTLEDDAAYVQALGASGFGAVGDVTGQGTTRGTSDQPRERREAQGAQTTAEAGSDEVFQSPTTTTEQHGRPLLPHAAVTSGSDPEAIASGVSGGLIPSPLPSPLTQSMQEAEPPAVSGGLNLAQHSANAVRWFTRLGEFVQRRVAQQTRPGMETTFVHETVWSPGGTARRSTGGAPENQPLFDHGQSRRLREMTLAAPQLYGSTTQRTGGSDSSASYTKEQMELEVKRQVEQAMRGHKALSDENQRLRLELERSRTQVREMMVETARQQPVLAATPAGGDGYVPEGNPPGLSGHSREQEGTSTLWTQAPGPQWDLRGTPEQDETLQVEMAVVMGMEDHQEPGVAANQGVIFQNYLGDLEGQKGEMLMEVTAYMVAILWDYQYATVNPEEGHFQNNVQDMSRDPVVSDGQLGRLSQASGGRLPDPAGKAADDKGPQGTSQMEALLKGMTQLQAAMTMQLGMAASKPETIRPGTSGAELPKLNEADEYAAINVGDWLHGLSGPMGDLTDGSSVWWAETMRCLDCFYQQFVTASAVKKLQLKAEDFMSPQLRDSRWHRVDKRAVSMLLQAVPEVMRAELLANRLGTTLGILGRIVTIYRPGSAVERQQVLKALENPGAGGSPAELVEVLRKWSRWLKRAQDLGLQVPDASILLRGLDAAARPQLSHNHEVNFRTNVLRYSLDLDAAPTLATVTKYHTHLLGEFEQLTYRGRGKGGATSIPAVKNVNLANPEVGGGAQKGGSSPQTPSSGKPCKFYLSETGCQRSNCKYAHDWNAIPREERTERCKGCGGKGHMRKNCPLKGAGADGGRRGDDAKGGGAPRVRNVASSPQVGADGKRDDGTLPQAAGPSPTAPSGSASASASVDSTQSGAGAPATSSASPKDMDDFIKSAAQVLKMMTEQHANTQANPSMKMLKKVVAEYEQKMALVDSGATHPLRRAATATEWVESPEVDVVVAGDNTTRMKQNLSGTLLTQPTTTVQSTSQTILPVGSLVNVLGYELRWCKRRCILRAPDGKEILLRTSTGCPEVDEAKALELIAEIEQENLNRLHRETETTRVAMLRAEGVQGDEQWEKSLKLYVNNGRLEDGFRSLVSAPWSLDIPREDLVKVVTDLPRDEAEAWQLMMQLGFNRRMRKRMVNQDWVVKIFSGGGSPMDKVFKAVEGNGTMVLDIDVQRMATLDVRCQGDGVMKLLLWGAATGRIAAVLGGVPRSQPRELLLRLLFIVEVAKVGRAAMCEASDIPDDGVAVSVWASSEAEEDETAQVWQLDWFRRWIAIQNWEVLHFEQGGLGHAVRRPTAMVTNLDVTELRGVRDQRTSTPERTTSWATWAPFLVRTLVRGVKRWKQRPGWYPRVLRALRAVDRKAWERHLANDHTPYRADCLQCIHNATGRPHRRCLHRDCYVLSADVLGPVRVPGPKGERHAIVFTYQFPKQRLAPEDQPIPDEDLVGWHLDAKEVEPERPLDEEEYSPDEGPDSELSPEELAELRRVQAEVVEAPDNEVLLGVRRVKIGNDREAKEDWWEFRESWGVLIRHHVAPRGQVVSTYLLEWLSSTPGEVGTY
eukprot:s318_g2.t1